MSQITSLYVHKVLNEVSAGVQTEDLLERLGMRPSAPIDPKLMVASDAYYDFFAELSARDPEGLSLPFRIGAAMRSDDYGAFGLAWKSAPNLRGSYARSERYGRVLGSAEAYTLQETREGWFFNLEKAGDGCLGQRLSNEASMSAVDAISKEVSTASFAPLAVYFKHAPRGDRAVYERHFGCPVNFTSGRDALLVSEDSIEAPNKLGDETIARFFDQHLERELAHVAEDQILEQDVRRVVTTLLSEGVPTLSLIATELGLGTRTLQRRLSDNGHTFQSVVDLARKDLAQRLLRETTYSLAEIAFLTGFAEQSGFTRAFKRWAGQTPRSYRLGVVSAKI
ncbi:MAG: AraC family transcriptional regulator ligand-binding domain-containing protein [Pseudomonadota bacterium]